MSSLDLVVGQVAPMGGSALLVGTASAREARSLAASLRRLLPEAVVVPGLRSVLVEGAGDLASAVAEAQRRPAADELAPSRHEIEVVLGGEDLGEVLELTGLDLPSLRAALEVELEVAVLGFSPGFGYLTGLGGPLAELPRRATPRPRVPAGSLAVAAGMAALYPQASPGGWWLLGSTAATLFDPADEERPSLLAAGDRVALSVVEEHGPRPAEPQRRPARPPAGSEAVLRVVASSPGAVVVDQGRRRLAPLGVPSARPADPERAVAAAALVGGMAALELPAAGLVLDAVRAVELGGIGLELEVDGRRVPEGRAIGLAAGQQLCVVGLRGPRGYLGISGGPAIEPVLGSMGTDALAGVGPGALAAGDEIGGRSLGLLASPAISTGASAPARLRFTPGPQAAAAPGGISGLRATVMASSNRVGVRLDPEGGPVDRVAGEVSSFGMVCGAIQLPPDGRPIVLGPDHATLGGYPVVGVVVADDLSLLGRLSSGDVIELVELDEDPSARG